MPGPRSLPGGVGMSRGYVCLDGGYIQWVRGRYGGMGMSRGMGMTRCV